MSDYKPGDVITVRVGTLLIDTVIDDHDVQRFPVDPILNAWVDGTTAATDSYNRTHRSASRRDDENFSLNNMAMLYHEGKFTFDEWLNFYLRIGYSVSGFGSLSTFSHLAIANPVWGATEEEVYADLEKNPELAFEPESDDEDDEEDLLS